MRLSQKIDAEAEAAAAAHRAERERIDAARAELEARRRRAAESDRAARLQLAADDRALVERRAALLRAEDQHARTQAIIFTRKLAHTSMRAFMYAYMHACAPACRHTSIDTCVHARTLFQCFYAS